MRLVTPDGVDSSCSPGVALRHNAVLYHCYGKSYPKPVTAVGIDLAKHVFQVHGITKDGAVVFNRAIRRAQLLWFFEELDPCLIGIGADVRYG